MLGTATNGNCRWIHQYDEEYNEIKSTRRKGQPAKPREDLLKLKASNLAAEYESGFCKSPITLRYVKHADLGSHTGCSYS